MIDRKVKMYIEMLLTVTLIGVVTGMVSGMAGFGSRLVIVPALLYSQYSAPGTSLN